MVEEAFPAPFPGLAWERVLCVRPPAEIFAMGWSPDGQVLATGSKDRTIRLWRVGGEPIAVLEGHEGTVLSVAFSLDGNRLASGSADGSIRLWDVAARRCLHELTGHSERVTSVAWSRHDDLIVSGSDDGTVRCWSTGEQGELAVLAGHRGPVNCVAVSSVSDVAASASFDRTVRLWNLTSMKSTSLVIHHRGAVNTVCFSPDGKLVATAGADATIGIWQGDGSLVRVLEGHTTMVRALAFSPDGRFLVSKSDGGSVRLWRCDRWQQIGSFPEETTSLILSVGISRDNVLATYADQQRAVCLWRLDPPALLAGATVREQYCNAKVVLVGDSGVGKSGLALALAGRPFEPTESTHGRNVWPLDERVVAVAPDLQETREILLWDLAGQPAYRLVHQLHLHDTTVAIIVFDARNDIDPLAGVHHWDRALRQARRGRLPDEAPLRKVLVVGRTDRGGVALGTARLAQLRGELGIREEDFFETSAKQGWGIAKLRDALNRLIDWDRLPKVTSTKLFHDIRAFVISMRGRRQRLLTVPGLCDAFLVARPGLASMDIRAQLETCIGRLESRGLVRRFTFGNYVLLEPELLDSYASAIVEAARDEPDGLGILAEDDARGALPHAEQPARRRARRTGAADRDDRVAGARRDRAPRGDRSRGRAAVSRAVDARAARRGGRAAAVASRGVRRLGPLGVRDARRATRAQWRVPARGDLAGWSAGHRLARCALRRPASQGDRGGRGARGPGVAADAGRDPRAARAVRHAHALKRAIAATVRAEAVLTCACGEVFQGSQVQKCIERNERWITCPVCEEKTPLGEPGDGPLTPEHVIVMDRDADARRDRDAASVSLQGKETARDFDVFLCHNSRDKAGVKLIGRELKTRGYLPWLDEWELAPGKPWQPELEARIESIRSAAVFIGGDGAGPWQNVELRALLSQFVERGCPVIPVILPSVTVPTPKLPTFLQGFTWVDFRLDDPKPLERLIWGITKTKPQPAGGEL